MTEKTKTLLKELAKQCLAALVAFVTALLSTSCGTTRATVRANADNTVSTITITTNNPTSVSVPSEATIHYKNSKDE